MSNYCEYIHNLCNTAKRFNFPFVDNNIPLNGIYILFEKGEHGHNSDRIVRIGTHTGKNQLLSRIHQHFLNENKDRSIFRKNIGRAILNKNNDDYLHLWEYDLTTKANKELYLDLIDIEKQSKIEKEISDYIQNNFAFSLLSIEDKEKRLEIEARIISTVSLCKECKPSENWLGNHSTKEKIRLSGLWLVNELWKQPLSESDTIFIEKTIIK